jgi:DHA1 family tetracycline resistance protein-like MFS transporter
LNAFIIMVFFRETIRKRINTPMNLLTGVHNIKRAFSLPNLRSLYAVSFLLGFGYNFFTQFFSVFMIARFQFTAAQIGVLFAYVGVWIAISQGVVTRIIARFVRPSAIIRWAPIATAVVLLFLAAVRHVQTVYLLLPLAALSYGLNPPNMNALISNAADERSQGEALGINQSMSALSFGLPPVLAGLAVSISIAMPMVLAAFFIMLAWFVFMRTHGRVEEPIFHEVS